MQNLLRFSKRYTFNTEMLRYQKLSIKKLNNGKIDSEGDDIPFIYSLKKSSARYLSEFIFTRYFETPVK